MRWMQARNSTRCSSCIAVIDSGDQYFGNSYSAFCKTCGEAKHKKELVYSRESKKYTNIDNISKCDYCKSPSIGHINGKTVCKDHIGDAVTI